jgi:type III pantothenate kinase
VNLLVDCGNSFIKWALVTDEPAIEESRCLSVEASSLHELWKNYDTPERVIVSNVAGQQFASEISRAAELLWQRGAEFVVSTQNCCGLSNNYQQPEQLGVDRWMAMLAAFKLTQNPVIIVDCGTAVTIDLVDEKGAFIGGVILPGLNTAFKSLRADTNAIEEISRELNDACPVAQSTERGVATGVILGLAGGIERVVTEQSSLVKTLPAVLLTGGDAMKLMSYMTIAVDYQENLVLQGLRVFADQ